MWGYLYYSYKKKAPQTYIQIEHTPHLMLQETAIKIQIFLPESHNVAHNFTVFKLYVKI